MATQTDSISIHLPKYEVSLFRKNLIKNKLRIIRLNPFILIRRQLAYQVILLVFKILFARFVSLEN